MTPIENTAPLNNLLPHGEISSPAIEGIVSQTRGIISDNPELQKFVAQNTSFSGMIADSLRTVNGRFQSLIGREPSAMEFADLVEMRKRLRAKNDGQSSDTV